MKKLIFSLCCSALLVGVMTSCAKNADKSKELELRERELALKEKELELKNPTAPTTPSAPTPPTSQPSVSSGKSGTIKGKGVIMRQLNSVESAKLGNFNENEVVTILDESKPQNQNQAIAAKPIKLYNDYNGKLMHTLNKGKALLIEKFEGGMYYVSYQHPELGKLFAMVEPSELESISNELWYKVKRGTGQEGWVLGKFLSK